MPDDAPSTLRFQSRFEPVLVCTAVLANPGGLILGAVLAGGIPHLSAMVGAVVVMCTACAIMSYAVSVWWPVYVRSETLRTYDLWGRYHEVAWGDIHSVKRFSLLNLRYLKCSSSGTPALYVPMFLARPDDFWRSVQACAGEDALVVEQMRQESGWA